MPSRLYKNSGIQTYTSSTSLNSGEAFTVRGREEVEKEVYRFREWTGRLRKTRPPGWSDGFREVAI
jgi:hypothetical protein